MSIKNLNVKTMDFFKEAHKQYGCLVAVAKALGSPIDDERFEKEVKIPNTVKIERQILEHVGLKEDKKENVKSVQKREPQKDHIPFYREIYGGRKR